MITDGFSLSDSVTIIRDAAHPSKMLAFKTTVMVILASGIATGQVTSNSSFDVLDYIDPLIGTANGGRYLAGLIHGR